MEVRHIKTCHGLQEVRFLDGALVPELTNLAELARAIERHKKLQRTLLSLLSQNPPPLSILLRPID